MEDCVERETLGKVAFEAFWQPCMSADPMEIFNNVANAVIAEHERRKWKPISKAHEDFSVCLFVNMRDPATYHVGTVLDDYWEEMAQEQGWTHFSPVLLTNETAQALLAELPAGPEAANEPA